jgi:D-alanine--D-alanine ligase
MQKLRVGVLMGGKSIEKEVSFNSGRTICDHLDTMRYSIIPLFQTASNELYILPWHFLHRGKISDFFNRLATEAEQIKWDDLKNHVDFIYIATHGRYAEDGTLQGFLEVLGIPYLGSKTFGSALGMDKIMQKKFLSMHDIGVPRGIAVYPYQIIDFEKHEKNIYEQLNNQNLSFPLIVKPYKEGSSLGVTIVNTQNDLCEAIKKACFIDERFSQKVLIEEKIEGMEFSCITITDCKTNTIIALPPTEVVADSHIGFFDYEQKYMPGRATEYTPARCSKEVQEKIQQTCIKAMHALNMSNLSRIDGFVKEDGTVVIVDPNTLSGMAPASFLFREAAYINMSHTQLINHLIETELQSYGMLDAILAQEKKDAKIMNTQKIRVGILMGGPSNEREISLESGRNITYKLSPHKYQPLPLFVNKQMELFPLTPQLLVLNSTAQIEKELDLNSKIAWNDLSKHVDFVFIGLHGGPGENGAVQGTLEMLEIPYNGSSVLTSALCMDKYQTTQFLHAQGFDVPEAILVSKKEWELSKTALIEKIIKNIPLPLIVKPHDDGCSVMVQKIKKESELVPAIELIFAHGKDHALIEECIYGMELTVGVVGNDQPRALPPSQAVSAADILSIEEKFLPGAGENQTPAPLPAAVLTFVQKTMEEVYKAVNAKGYARIDCFYQNAHQSSTKKERVILLEINTLPGMTPATCIFHQAAEVGIKPMDFIDLIITLGFEEHKKLNAQSGAKVISEKIKNTNKIINDSQR